LLGSSLTHKLTATFNNLDELALPCAQEIIRKRLDLSEDEIKRVNALSQLYAGKSESSEQDEPIYIDRRYKLAKPFGEIFKKNPEIETLACAYLGYENRLLDICILGEGNHETVVFEFRKMFVKACQIDAKRIILAHNHPGYEYEPSTCDINSTQKAILAGGILGIPVVDHYIMCPSAEEPGCWHFQSFFDQCEPPVQKLLSVLTREEP